MDGLMILRAVPEDVPTIRSIALKAWPIAYSSILSAAQLDYMLELMYSERALRLQMEQGHDFLLALRDGGPIGFAGYGHHHNGSSSTRLHKLYLLPEAKHMGTGRALVTAVIDAARSAGDLTIVLNVNRYNPSVEFYRHMGFRSVREEVIDIGKGYIMDDFVMERPVRDQDAT